MACDAKKAEHELTRYNNEEIRIVMVGKTGVGKSATGNTILGTKYFKSEFSPKSSTTVCKKAFGEVDGQKVSVIDTRFAISASALYNPNMGDTICKCASRPEPTILAEPTTTYHYDEEMRIVLVGKTGAGKSATGNTILGSKHFKSEIAAKSLTKHCKKVDGGMDGQKVAVIDTPGLFDTNTDEKETSKNIVQSISYASPGPHILLVVIQIGRFTEEEKKTVQKIQKIFGEEADRYSMVLFTHGDQLKGKPIEEFVKDSKDLQELVDKCNGQYHVFNNNEVKDRSQVRELLKKIRTITEKNGGSYYTNEMFQRAERAIEEEKQRILKEKEEQMRKEREELRKETIKRFEQQMREAQDRKREEDLRAARERELEEELKKLKEMQEKRAREEAENSSSLLKTLNNIFVPILVAAITILRSYM